MNEISKNGLFLFFRIFIVGIMCAITTISVFFLFTAICTENIGYNAVVTDKDGKTVKEYTYYEKDGDDIMGEDYEGKGYTVNKTNIRSKLKGKAYVTCSVICELISLGMLYTFIYNKLFELGNKDINLVKCKHKAEDKLKGLKIGLVSSVPAFLTYIGLLIMKFAVKTKIAVSFYSIINMPFFQLFKSIYGNKTKISELGIVEVILLVLPLLIIPLFAQISYTLGYKDIFIMQKVVYKNKNKNGANR